MTRDEFWELTSTDEFRIIEYIGSETGKVYVHVGVIGREPADSYGTYVTVSVFGPPLPGHHWYSLLYEQIRSVT